jgi:DNA-binding MarR family transcriptional regulator
MAPPATVSDAEENTPIEDLPPSAKLVVKVLEYEGDLTQAQLVDSTLLPARTVRHALAKLEDNDIVRSRISLVDARKQIYTLVDTDDWS